MKFQDLQLNEEYAVIPSWQYSSKDKKDPMRVRKNDVLQAKLVSLTKYEYSVYRSQDPDDLAFVKAPQGSRSVGYLMSALDFSSNTKVYWLARPQDIVERWSVLEPRWAEAERLEREQQEKQRLEQEKREQERKNAQEQRQRLEKATIESLVSILGTRANNTNIRFDTRSGRDNEGNYKEINIVQLDVEVAHILIEKVLEAKEVLG
jgi:hypothetical protein